MSGVFDEPLRATLHEDDEPIPCLMLGVDFASHGDHTIALLCMPDGTLACRSIDSVRVDFRFLTDDNSWRDMSELDDAGNLIQWSDPSPGEDEV